MGRLYDVCQFSHRATIWFSLLTRQMISCLTFEFWSPILTYFSKSYRKVLKSNLILLCVSLPFLLNMLFQACQFENIPLSITNEITILISEVRIITVYSVVVSMRSRWSYLRLFQNLKTLLSLSLYLKMRR